MELGNAYRNLYRCHSLRSGPSSPYTHTFGDEDRWMEIRIKLNSNLKKITVMDLSFIINSGQISKLEA